MAKDSINDKAEQLKENGWLVVSGEETAAEIAAALPKDIAAQVVLTRDKKTFYIAMRSWYDAHALDTDLTPDGAAVIKAIDEELNPRESTTKQPSTLSFFTDQYGRVFASVLIESGGVANYAIRSKAFRGIAALQVMQEVDGRGNPKKPTADHISTFLAECEAQAYKTKLVYDIYNRAARFGDDYFIDLADAAWRVVRFNYAGWQVLAAQPHPMFMRYSHQQAISIDAEGDKAAFNNFIDLLHVSTEYRIQVETYTILTGLAGIQHVILYMIGAQGAVKTTAQELIGAVFDPTITETLTLPHQQRELVQQLMHHYTPIYDNVDLISDDIASDLCRACTGGGFEKRQLYTDDDDVIYRYRRKVMLNGINIANQRPDFIERCLIIPQERVTNEQRKPKEEVLKEAAELLPKVRAYCLDMLVKAVNEYPKVAQELRGRLPRMADYCIWAEAVSRALGNPPLTFYTQYMAQQSRQTLEALLSDAVGELVLAWLDGNEEWQNNKAVSVAPKQLHSDLLAMAEERKYNLKQIRFPGSPTWLSNRLNNLKHNLAEYGIRIDTGVRGRTSNSYLFTLNCSTSSNSSTLSRQTGGGAIQNVVEQSEQSRGGGAIQNAVEQSKLILPQQKPDDSGASGASGAIKGYNMGNNTSSVQSREASAGSGVHLPADGVGVAHAPTPPGNKPSPNPELIQGRVQSFISRLPISGVIAGPKWGDWSYLINSNFADLPQEEVAREFKKALELGDLLVLSRSDGLFSVAPARRQVNTDPEYDNIE